MNRPALLPAAFVFLWCSGYLVVRIALPDAGPVRFLGLRFGSAAVLLALAAFALRAPWARRAIDYGHMAVVGLLLHGIGLGGVWVALGAGLKLSTPSALGSVYAGAQHVVWLHVRPFGDTLLTKCHVDAWNFL